MLFCKICYNYFHPFSKGVVIVVPKIFGNRFVVETDNDHKEFAFDHPISVKEFAESMLILEKVKLQVYLDQQLVAEFDEPISLIEEKKNEIEYNPKNMTLDFLMSVLMKRKNGFRISFDGETTKITIYRKEIEIHFFFPKEVCSKITAYTPGNFKPTQAQFEQFLNQQI